MPSSIGGTLRSAAARTRFAPPPAQLDALARRGLRGSGSGSARTRVTPGRPRAEPLRGRPAEFVDARCRSAASAISTVELGGQPLEGA